MGKRESKKKRSEEKEDDQAKMVGLFDDLAKVSRDIEKANHELQKKLRRVERDYNSHRRPLWEQRSKIINQIDEFYAHVVRCAKSLTNLQRTSHSLFLLFFLSHSLFSSQNTRWYLLLFVNRTCPCSTKSVTLRFLTKQLAKM